MKHAYNIPCTVPVQEYFNMISGLSVVWDDPNVKSIIADGEGYVEVAGTIPDAAEIPVRVISTPQVP